MYCEKCNAKLSDNTKFCTSCGAYIESRKHEAQDPNAPLYQDPFRGFPMKWHKFLIYFALWASAVLNLVFATRTLTLVFGGNADYSAVPNIFKYIDVIYAVITIGIAALQFVTVVRLIGLKRGAPQLLIKTYIAVGASDVIYTVIAYAILIKQYGSVMSLLSPTLVFKIAISVIMVCANIMYYKKREALFVN